jgi:hypothetical protein
MLSQFLKTGSATTNDIIVLVTLFVLFATYALYFGKGRIISFILAFYPAVFLYEEFPYMAKFMLLHGTQLIVLNKIIIFLIFLISLGIMINRFIFSESGYGGSLHLARVAGFALIGVVLTLVFTYSVVSLDVFYTFSPMVSNLFVPANIFWWTLGPLLLMFLL